MSALFKLASRGSVVAALAFLTLAPACGDDDGDDDASDAGSSGEGGSAGSAGSGGKAGGGGSAGKAGGGGSGGSTGGRGGTAGTAGTSNTEAGAAGTPDSAGGTGATDAGGSGGDDGTAGVPGAGGGGAGVPGGEGGTGGVGDDDPAVAKFCNTLTFGDDPTTMILEIGEGSEKVTFTADTDECAPPDGNVCIAIPVGEDVTIALFDADAPETALDEAPLDIEPGVAYVFNSNVLEAQPVWEYGEVDDFAACQDFTFEDL